LLNASTRTVVEYSSDLRRHLKFISDPPSSSISDPFEAEVCPDSTNICLHKSVQGLEIKKRDSPLQTGGAVAVRL